VTAGAKVQAMTVLDLVIAPELVEQGLAYFRDVQTKETSTSPLLRPAGPARDLAEQGDHGKYRPEMKKYYYDLPSAVQGPTSRAARHSSNPTGESW
jgi:aminobenzoyl-glutamate utilization protein B